MGDTVEQARRLYGAIQDLGNGIYAVEEQFSLIYKLQFQVEGGTIRRIGLYGDLLVYAVRLQPSKIFVANMGFLRFNT